MSINEILDKAGITRAIMYHVEKFLPTACPRCHHLFQKESEDWHRLLGDIVAGKKVVRDTDGYAIIVCSHCENYTAQIPSIETHQVLSKEKAKELCDKEGFFNLIEVQAFGTACQESHSQAVLSEVIGGVLPPECPKCRQLFTKEDKDWVRFDGDTIICNTCKNYTRQFTKRKYGVKIFGIDCTKPFEPHES